jgi:hypothetical protein
MRVRKSNTILRLLRVLLIVFAVSMLAVPVIVSAEQLNFPLKAYTDEELAKVREWEKTWAGKKIDKSNVGQIKEYLPESYAGAYAKPEVWFEPEGFWFTIAPYARKIETKGMIEATNKFHTQVKTDANSEVIQNYADIAGMPFPNPDLSDPKKGGNQIAWNYDFNTHGDAYHWLRTGPSLTVQNHTERVSSQDMYELYYVSRVDVDPKPNLLQDNKKGIRRGYFIHLFKPPEFINTRMFNLRYLDMTKSDDGYMWYSQFRRIRRISTAQRTDSIDGSDLIYDDEFLWDGHITRNNYKYVGRKDLLCARHQDIKQLQRTPGHAMPNGINRERLNTLVVEVTSKDKNYIYKKRMWYVDPETYYIQWTEIYDQLDRFWKCFENWTNPNKEEATGEMKSVICGTQMMDFQRIHCGISIQECKGVGLTQVDQNMFTISNLQKGGY